MNRLFPRIAVGLLTLTVGIFAHFQTSRIASYFEPEVEAISAPNSPQLTDPTIEKSCEKITKAWFDLTLSRPIPSYVQIRCWGVDEGKAHPLAQIIRSEEHTSELQ